LNIELHIEHLVLDGLTVTPRERTLIGAAVESELSRLLREGGLAGELAGGVALPSLDTGNIQLASGNDPWRLGEQIARAVYGGIGKPTGFEAMIESATAQNIAVAVPEEKKK
jgi:hypothetical protein